MTPEKEEFLFRNYPIFDRKHERFETGFNCEDGWFDLVEFVGQWLPFARIPGLKVIGIKEKFGRIVIDVEFTDEEDEFKINLLLEGIMEDSASICERCGEDKDSQKDHCKPMNALHPRQ